MKGNMDIRFWELHDSSRLDHLTRCPNYNFIPASPAWHNILVHEGYIYLSTAK